MDTSTIISLGISILSIVFCISTFVRSGNKDTKKEASQDSYRWGQLDAQLKNINNQIEKILIKLDKTDEEVDAKIEKAINLHLSIYHKGD